MSGPKRKPLSAARPWAAALLAALGICAGGGAGAYGQEAPEGRAGGAGGAGLEAEALEGGPGEEGLGEGAEALREGALGEGEGEGEGEKAPEDGVFVVRGFDFDIKGSTRPFALIYHGELVEGEELRGEGALEGYIADKTRMLRNQRVLDTVAIEYTLGEAEADGRIPARFLIRVKDTWNIIVLPKPEIDSNDGFSLVMKARDYNFLGTMSALRVDAGYELAAEYMDDVFGNLSRGTVVFSLDSDIPMKFKGLNWTFNFDHEVGYTFEEPLYYKNTTGLSLELPWRWDTAFTVGFNQYTIINEKNTDSDILKRPELEERFEGGYGASEVFASWKIPLGVKAGPYGELSYTPKLSGRLNYGYGRELDYVRKSPSVTFSHSAGFGEINWLGNYRDGLEASVGNEDGYNFGKEEWSVSLTAQAAYHKRFFSFLGLSSRLMYRHYFNAEGYNSEAADVLRGVLNDKLSADYMLSLNLDLPVRLLRFYPSEWFNAPRLRLFNCEFFFSPFLDAALVKESGSAPHPDTLFEGRLAAGAGAEALLFPAIMRSIYLRVSFGYNLRDTSSVTDWEEVFIGIGHFY